VTVEPEDLRAYEKTLIAFGVYNIDVGVIRADGLYKIPLPEPVLRKGNFFVRSGPSQGECKNKKNEGQIFRGGVQ